MSNTAFTYDPATDVLDRAAGPVPGSTTLTVRQARAKVAAAT